MATVHLGCNNLRPYRVLYSTKIPHLKTETLEHCQTQTKPYYSKQPKYKFKFKFKIQLIVGIIFQTIIHYIKTNHFKWLLYV